MSSENSTEARPAPDQEAERRPLVGDRGLALGRGKYGLRRLKHKGLIRLRKKHRYELTPW